MRANEADSGRLAVLVPGGRGQLGSDLATVGARFGTVRAPGSAELDITDATAIAHALDELRAAATDSGAAPVVCNAAAYTLVDAAESDVERAFAVNATGPGLLAAACAARDIPLLHVSTDYVFPGDADHPYEPDDETGPHTVYGRSKLAGEQAVLAAGPLTWVVRTAWVYGATGGNFVKTMARLGRERPELSVVDDQRGTPTWSADLAAGLLSLAELVTSGSGTGPRVLHCTGGGDTTWHGFARAIFTALGEDPSRVKPCTTADFPRAAPRPAYSVLSDASWRAAGLTPLRPWDAALTDFVATHRAVLEP